MITGDHPSTAASVARMVGIDGERVLTGELGSTDPIWVAHVVMVDFERTEVEAMAVGTRVRLELAPLEEHHDLEETSWVDDTDAGLRIWFPTAWETLD